jgi:ABC-type lipoprotein export system ATPase subunit
VLSGSPLWLLDEPTAALDEATRDRLLEQIVGLARAARVAVLVASHDPVVLARCDRCITLRGAR